MSLSVRIRSRNGAARGMTIALLTVCASLSMASACSIFRSSKADLSIATSPPGASVTVNGEPVGVTPIRTSVPRDAVSILIELYGYKPESKEVPCGLSWSGILDIVGGCIFLLPFIGLLFPGAYTPDTTTFSIVLERIP